MGGMKGEPQRKAVEAVELPEDAAPRFRRYFIGPGRHGALDLKDENNGYWSEPIAEEFIREFERRRDNDENIEELLNEFYARTMEKHEQDIERLALSFGLTNKARAQFVATVKEALATAREASSRSWAANSRLKWQRDRKPDETPADFAARARYEHRGQIYSEDRDLHRRLNSWLRSYDWPEGVRYVPTKSEWNDRQVAKGSALPVVSDEVREYHRASHTSPAPPRKLDHVGRIAGRCRFCDRSGCRFHAARPSCRCRGAKALTCGASRNGGPAGATPPWQATWPYFCTDKLWLARAEREFFREFCHIGRRWDVRRDAAINGLSAALASGQSGRFTFSRRSPFPTPNASPRRFAPKG
jgi:hypothetical protein